MSNRNYTAVQLLPGNVLVFTALNLQEGERYKVRWVVDTRGNMEDQPDVEYIPNGKAVEITNTSNPVMVTIPGWYRIVPDGVLNPTADVYCKQERLRHE